MTSEKIQPGPGVAFSFIHAADLHLGSSVQGVAVVNDYTTQTLADATYLAWDRIIDLCLINNVDFLILSGDIYDSGDRNIQAQLRFIKGLKKIAEHGIRSYIVHGNHDPLPFWSSSVTLPPEAIRFTSSTPEQIFHTKNGTIVAKIVGASIPERYTEDNLVKIFPRKETDWPFTIGIVHCNVDGSAGHDPYAPCGKRDLVNTDYDYWALGHIHLPTVIQDTNPAIIYSGNPQGRHIGESGPRGCYLVTVDDKKRFQAEFLPTQAVRFEHLTIHTDGVDMLDEFIDYVTDHLGALSEELKCPLICRVTLKGRTAVDTTLSDVGDFEDVRSRIEENCRIFRYPVILERMENLTYPVIDRGTVRERTDLAGDICRIADSLMADEGADEQIQEVLGPLFANHRYRHSLESCNTEELHELIREAEGLLLSRLVGGEDS